MQCGAVQFQYIKGIHLHCKLPQSMATFQITSLLIQNLGYGYFSALVTQIFGGDFQMQRVLKIAVKGLNLFQLMTFFILFIGQS